MRLASLTLAFVLFSYGAGNPTQGLVLSLSYTPNLSLSFWDSFLAFAPLPCWVAFPSEDLAHLFAPSPADGYWVVANLSWLWTQLLGTVLQDLSLLGQQNGCWHHRSLLKISNVCLPCSYYCQRLWREFNLISSLSGKYLQVWKQK